MIDVLRNDLGYDSDEDFRFWEKQYGQLCQLDGDAEADLVKKYKGILNDKKSQYIRRISQLVSLVLQEQDFFTLEKWKKLRDEYNSTDDVFRLSEMFGSSGRNRCLVNVAWLKRIDIFKDRLLDSNDLEGYKRAHEEEKSYFKNIIKCLARLGNQRHN